MPTGQPEIIRNLRVGGTGKSTSFPKDIGNSPNFFSIALMDYIPAVSMTANMYGGGDYFHFPMPIKGLEDNFSIKYKDTELGAVGAVVSSYATGGLAGMVGTAISGTLIKDLRDMFSAGAASLGDKAGANPQQSRAAASLASGRVDNPNLALLFQGVPLREHEFSWKFIPENAGESNQLMSIIRKLKSGALPSRELSGNYALTYPKVAFCFLKGPTNDSVLTFNKQGMFITDIQVNYQGGSHAAFFQGTNNPVEIELKIKFRERGIVTSEDISTGANF